MKNKISTSRKLSLGLIAWALCFNCCYSQSLTHQQFWDKLIIIENSNYDIDKKLSELTALKKQYEDAGFEKDSVYARMLHRMGVYQSWANQLQDAIQNTLESIRINSSKKRSACPSFTANSYSNLGFYCLASLRYNDAISYFDSSIAVSNHFAGNDENIILARLYKGGIFFKKGNYEKDIEETSLGLPVAEKIKDTFNIVNLLLERAQSCIMQEKFNYALNDINKSFVLLPGLNRDDCWANAFRHKADILAKQNNCKEAFELYKQCIYYRKKINAPIQTAIDYNDAGYLLLKNCNNADAAKKYFDTAYKMGLQLNDNITCALALYNLGEISFLKAGYKKALEQNQQSLQYLFPHYKLNNFINPPRKEFLTLNSKGIAETILSNKNKFLLYLYKQTNNKQFLQSCIATARLNDSIITDLRHEQTGEQSKLYWRNDTRDFFTNALEACYLDNNAPLAFYFMEKSRAVLLNDKLNELGAAIHLPAQESAKEERLQENITIQQQRLATLNENTSEYAMQLNKLLQAKEDFEHYIKSLEQNYPAYYQYKYDDEVPSLQSLQQYLGKNNQSFVHYFLGDTATYILAITSNKTQLIKLAKKDFNKEKLSQFLELCANKQALMNDYNSFTSLSNSIYKIIFQPLQLPKGRIIICSDNIVIPFDALCTDANGKNFLLNNYCFSYVYSARFLMKKFETHSANGNFLGFAPVSYASNLRAPVLVNAAEALTKSSSFYKNDKLFTETNATRNNFFNYVSQYTVVNIFSHAHADTTDNEPVLFMQDSLIHLSELQLLNDPATKLILLSACQTNVGKTATGEGIYSLARGFATAGIPSVAATLWKADEQAIYSISEKFNQYLSQGMNKDEALQKAKSDFIQSNNSGKMLPYYWANMILIGNADALNFKTGATHNYVWMIIAGIALLIATILLLKKQKQKAKRFKFKASR